MTVELYLLQRIEQLEKALSRITESDPEYATLQFSRMELLKVLDFIQK